MSADARAVELDEVRFGRVVERPGGRAAPAEAGPTDLERLVSAANAAATEADARRPEPPWLPPLPEVLPAEALPADRSPAHVVPLGRVDLPRSQRQETWSLDLERDGSALVFGATRSGKTSLLRTLAVQLARRSDPRHLHIYGLDFGGHGLAGLAALPHCGEVLAGEDPEPVARLLTSLAREIDVRGRRFAEAGVASLADFQAAHPEAQWPPRIVILIDSYGGFASTFDVGSADLPALVARIVSAGRSAGIHIVATADRRNAIPASLTSLVSQRIVLRLAGEDEYLSLGLDGRAIRGVELAPGRGFVGDTLELQIADVGPIADAAADLVAQHGAHAAPPVPRVPVRVDRAQLPAAASAARPPLGISAGELAVAHADISQSAFLVCGPFHSGRSTSLATLAAALRDAAPDLEIHLLAPRRSVLAEMAGTFTSVARGDGCVQTVCELADRVTGRSPDEDHPLLVVVIDDVTLLAEGPAAGPLEALLRNARDVNVRVVAACEASQARGFSPVLRELRKDGNGLLLQPDLDMDGDLLGVRLPRRGVARFPPGRGYLVNDGRVELVQVATAAD